MKYLEREVELSKLNTLHNVCYVMYLKDKKYINQKSLRFTISKTFCF